MTEIRSAPAPKDRKTKKEWSLHTLLSLACLLTFFWIFFATAWLDQTQRLDNLSREVNNLRVALREQGVDLARLHSDKLALQKQLDQLNVKPPKEDKSSNGEKSKKSKKSSLPIFVWFDMPNGMEPTSDSKCVRITESRTPNFHDYRLCSDKDLTGWEWSENGPIRGKRCVAWSEPGTQGWDNNFLCMPLEDGFHYAWSHGGLIPDMSCSRIYTDEPSLKSVWDDNYFCVSKDYPSKNYLWYVYKEATYYV